MMIFLCFSSIFSLHEKMSPSIVFEQASVHDLEGILVLQDNFNEDDAARLVVFPPEVRAGVLKAALEAGKIFVACDAAQEGCPIVGFCKIYLIDDAHELKGILCDELRALTPACVVCEPAYAYTSEISLSQANNFSAPIFFEQAPVVVPTVDDICVYYGGAYVLPEYRAQGLSTKLEQFGLEQLAQKLRSYNNEGKGVFYMYGVVSANFYVDGASDRFRVTRHRSFMNFLNSVLGNKLLPQDSLPISFSVFHSCKPTLIFRDGSLQVAPDAAENRGFGCIIGCVSSI